MRWFIFRRIFGLGTAFGYGGLVVGLSVGVTESLGKIADWVKPQDGTPWNFLQEFGFRRFKYFLPIGLALAGNTESCRRNEAWLTDGPKLNRVAVSTLPLDLHSRKFVQKKDFSWKHFQATVRTLTGDVISWIGLGFDFSQPAVIDFRGIWQPISPATGILKSLYIF